MKGCVQEEKSGILDPLAETERYSTGVEIYSHTDTAVWKCWTRGKRSVGVLA